MLLLPSVFVTAELQLQLLDSRVHLCVMLSCMVQCVVVTCNAKLSFLVAVINVSVVMLIRYFKFQDARCCCVFVNLFMDSLILIASYIVNVLPLSFQLDVKVKTCLKEALNSSPG